MSPATAYQHSHDNIQSLIDIAKVHDVAYTTNIHERTAKSITKHSLAAPEEIPLVVFTPESTEKTAILLKECNARRISVTSFSGGTSFGGALTATRGGVCISFEKMKDIIALHEDDMDVVVQPGLGWVELNAQLREKGLFFPVDPAPGASIGGMIAMSCSGTNAYRYGTMKEWVISLVVVLADGSIIKTHHRPRKSAAGYDLTHLMIGSEGTLGLVTEVVLRLTTLPKNLHVGMAIFDSFQQGVDAVIAFQKYGHKLEMLELADGPQIHAINRSKLAQLHLEEKPTLFMKFAGASLQAVNDQIKSVKQICSATKAIRLEVTNTSERIDAIWGARKCIGHALVAMKQEPTDVFLHTDCAVPISNLAALVKGTQKLIKDSNTSTSKKWFCANVGHVGDGNVHSSVIVPIEDKEKAEKTLREVARLALRLEGTVTGEHGVGLKLRDALIEEVGISGVNAMRRIKASLDEHSILNPDKIFTSGEANKMKAKL
ncbi:FAD-binding domain-containing protein [Aaosphaeria arxii CBS 175.79]|uniref:FAD-binding domain-containing protein n=1 Tax=Aaosphaeria arxii CBS 175.79 TaxID=1450172 RepID=A0A6A5XJ61_9PLEO|nr:FAD-binding domain-containing protein [Aaosphaeria arxii CBS 175.79]KAF2012906.1 FAD-binding domain-containing protein [Aaosphaeria arxii CBS 175.79]